MIGDYEVSFSKTESEKIYSDNSKLKRAIELKITEFTDTMREDGVKGCLFFVFKNGKHRTGAFCNRTHLVIALESLLEELNKEFK